MSDNSSISAGLPDLKKGTLQANLLSGFLVFLIALPLCLGIAKASGYPPIAGVWTAVLGGLVTTFIGNSELTIKGPAAGMIVIVLGAVTDFTDEIVRPDIKKAEETLGHEIKQGSDQYKKIVKETGADLRGYLMAIGVGVVGGIIQIIFGLARAGALADFFPLSAVHGLLASIGLIIMFKQVYWLIGLDPPGGTALDPLLQLPASLENTVQNVALIGIPCLVLMFVIASIRNKAVKKVPPQVFVLIFAISMGFVLNIDALKDSAGVSKYLVNIPNVLGDPGSAFAFPDFSGIATSTGINYIFLFAMVGSLESLLSAKAIDLLDPWKRKTNLNRDMLGVGVANTLASAVGALPMISEIVRSRANIDNGGRTRYANMFHGVFLLLAVLFLGSVIHRIPLASLGAMLVFTGYRLANPREFVKTFKIGPEQFLIFVTTIVAVLMTDLLKGIAAGFAMKLLILLAQGISPAAWFRCDTKVLPREDGSVVVYVGGPMIFLNWIRLKPRLVGFQATHVIVDVSNVSYIDHTTMEKLHELEMDFHNSGRHLEVAGLDHLKPFTPHLFAARKDKAVGGESAPIKP